ncbi:hypothetical protein [Pararhizobium mangrovi]|uniref:Uncharacterized protein n=1 Tax=Pararhizobium mangrovi TaxID=2590452 RepID=A0A506TYP8_9HYPH|nr:hypothetical protein [Pararhizobium mangrovi]TPW25845.1 hypothetical protein FJU11_17455 [Pararhizobium mangrovi]
MKDLFEFPEEPSGDPKPRRPRTNDGVAVSHIVEQSSERGKKPIQYVRLTHEDHEDLQELVRCLTHLQKAECIDVILKRSSGNYGSALGRPSTLGDMLTGVRGKLHRNHPVVPGRQGQDVTVKQLESINRLAMAVNGCLPEDDHNVLKVVPVPKR